MLSTSFIRYECCTSLDDKEDALKPGNGSGS
jgi:hypothetical protein